MRQIRHALKKCDGEFSVYKEQGRIYVDCEGMYDYEETVGHLQHVFGIVGICPVMQVEDHGIEELGDSVIEFLTNVYDIDAQTFKVNTRRANKQYPIESMEVNAILGGRILDAFPNMKVDVHHPEYSDSRWNCVRAARFVIYSKIIPGPGADAAWEPTERPCCCSPEASTVRWQAI